MKGRAIIPLVVGLVVGIFAIKLFVDVLQKAKSQGSADMVQVVRATCDIGAAAEIQEGMVEVAEIPKSLAPKQAFPNTQKAIGRVTTQMIPSGTPVVAGFLAPEGTPPGMAARINDGYRAVAIRVDEIVGVAGWIKPGARVDVAVVMCGKGVGRSGDISKIVLQDVEVLAVGQEIDSKDPNAAVQRSVTVLVDPKDVTKLNLAASKGKLQLAMRNQLDRAKPDSPIMTEKDLLTDLPQKKQGAESHKGSLLARLFSQDGQQTDKTDDSADAAAKVKVTPVQLAVAPLLPKREWTVEVISGPVMDQVLFSSSDRDARRLSGSNGTGAAARHQGPMPYADAPGNPGTATEQAKTSAGPDAGNDNPRAAPQDRVE